MIMVILPGNIILLLSQILPFCVIPFYYSGRKYDNDFTCPIYCTYLAIGRKQYNGAYIYH